jgi:hypothetical protein
MEFNIVILLIISKGTYSFDNKNKIYGKVNLISIQSRIILEVKMSIIKAIEMEYS